MTIKNITALLAIITLLTGCVDSSFATGVATGLAGTPRAAAQPRASVMDDYYANQSRRADREVIR